MPRFTLRRLLPLAALGLGLMLGSPTRVHAQDDDEEGGQQMDEKTREEVQKFEQRLNDAVKELEAKDYDNALKHYEKLFARLEKSTLDKKYKDQIEQLARYNYACGLSLTNKKEEAIKAFSRSVELGFWDWKHIDEDTDLDNIRNEDGFKKAIEMGKALEKKKGESSIKDSLAGPPPFAFDFTTKTVDGKDLKLADLKGKVVIVDFWGTWCPPCRAEIPHFVKLYETYKAKGLEIVGLSLEHEPDPAKAAQGVQEFAKKNSIQYPLALVTNDDAAVKMVPNFHAVPTTLFIDKDGKVRTMRVGARSYEELEQIVLALFDAKPAEATTAPPKKDDAKPETPKKDDSKKDDDKPF
jgi:thiol-disulfide isomerase/thioredoxin